MSFAMTVRSRVYLTHELVDQPLWRADAYKAANEQGGPGGYVGDRFFDGDGVHAVRPLLRHRLGCSGTDRGPSVLYNYIEFGGGGLSTSGKCHRCHVLRAPLLGSLTQGL